MDWFDDLDDFDDEYDADTEMDDPLDGDSECDAESNQAESQDDENSRPRMLFWLAVRDRLRIRGRLKRTETEEAEKGQ